MKPTAESVLLEAMRLPEPDRVALAARLLRSLDEPADPDAAVAWEAEIAARIRELDEGRVQTVPWVEARRRILG
jgi:putative addiction module component (TIGR02574 family)